MKTLETSMRHLKQNINTPKTKKKSKHETQNDTFEQEKTMDNGTLVTSSTY